MQEKQKLPNVENETKEIHEKMRKFFTPSTGNIIVEFVENLKTNTGIYLIEGSEEIKSIAHPIVCLPNEPITTIPNLKIGDWVSLRNIQLDVIKLYGRKFAMIRDFDIAMKVDMNYLKDEDLFKTVWKKTRLAIN